MNYNPEMLPNSQFCILLSSNYTWYALPVGGTNKRREISVEEEKKLQLFANKRRWYLKNSDVGG